MMPISNDRIIEPLGGVAVPGLPFLYCVQIVKTYNILSIFCVEITIGSLLYLLHLCYCEYWIGWAHAVFSVTLTIIFHSLAPIQ